MDGGTVGATDEIPAAAAAADDAVAVTVAVDVLAQPFR